MKKQDCTVVAFWGNNTCDLWAVLDVYAEVSNEATYPCRRELEQENEVLRHCWKFPTKRLIPVAGRKWITELQYPNVKFPTKRLIPVAGSKCQKADESVQWIELFPTKRLIPVAGRGRLFPSST